MSKRSVDLVAAAIEQGEIGTREAAPVVRALALDVSGCKDLTGLGEFARVEVLRLSTNGSLSLRGIEALDALRSLVVVANRVTDLDRLSSLAHLDALTLGAIRQGDLTGLASSSLTQLSAVHAGVKSLDGMALPSLRRADLKMNKLADLGPLAGSPMLRGLDLQDNPIGDLSALRGLPLRSLSLCGARKLKSLAALEGFPELETLVLTGVGAKDRSIVERLPRLTHLLDVGHPVRHRALLPWPDALRAEGWVDDAVGAGRLAAMEEHLGADGLRGIGACGGLRAVYVYPSGGLVGVEALGALVSLSIEGVYDQGAVGVHVSPPVALDFAPVGALTGLEHLVVKHPLRSLRELPGLPALRRLDVRSHRGERVSTEGFERFPALCSLVVDGRVTAWA